MFALGLANLYVVANYSPIVWGYFLSIGATGAKIIAFFAQYLVFQIWCSKFSSAGGCGRRFLPRLAIREQTHKPLLPFPLAIAPRRRRLDDDGFASIDDGRIATA